MQAYIRGRMSAIGDKIETKTVQYKQLDTIDPRPLQVFELTFY